MYGTMYAEAMPFQVSDSKTTAQLSLLRVGSQSSAGHVQKEVHKEWTYSSGDKSSH